ncbi:MAG: glycosyltransferase, partial [bacterium]
AEAPSGRRLELGIAKDEAVLAFAGELREKKGLTFMLEALREVKAERPACLLVIGEVRAREQARLASFAAEHPEAGSRILVTGRLSEQARVVEHLRLADVFLHPSVWDGLPNAVLEAMACGRIVIGSDAGGIPDCIEHSRNGFLIPRHALHRLGEAILEVLSLPESERQSLAQAARATVQERFRPEIEERRLKAVLQRLWVESGGSPRTQS